MTMKQIWLSHWFGKVRQCQGSPQGRGGLGALLGKDVPTDYFFPLFPLAIPFAFAIQCEREEEVGAKPPPILVPSPPQIFM